MVPLGAGQDVGRSCILLSIGGRNIMLDCGMHMGYSDERCFPDFSYASDFFLCFFFFFFFQKIHYLFTLKTSMVSFV